jgi:tetratricopeptide (TPR) repeat protein
MRNVEKEVKLSDVALLLESAEAAGTADPATTLPKIQEALRCCRRAGGAQCLESRCFSVLGLLLVMMGRTRPSERAFEVSYRADCRCCRPFIDRRFAYLLHEQGRHEAAVRRAERAADDARGSLKGLAVLTLGEMRYHAGDVSGAIRDCNEAVRRIPVTSPHHSPALAALVYCLGHSERPEDVAEAFAMIPGLERRFLGVKRKSQQRAKLAWVTGGILARHAVFFKLRGWKLRGQLATAREYLDKGVSGLERLGTMPLDAAAARTDLAGIHAMIDPLTVEDILDGIDVAALTSLKTAALEAAQAILAPERISQLWVALRELRDATVEAGCDPPLVPYPSVG